MQAIKVKLHHTQKTRIAEMLKYEEPRVIRRCNILSCLDSGMGTGLIAQVLHVDPKTVRNIAKHFNESGMDAALFDEQRSGRPIDIGDTEKSRIVAMVCENPPSGACRWTLELIVEEIARRDLLGGPVPAKETVRLMLHDHDLKPWREKMWCIEERSPEYIERMEDVLEVYERPLDQKKPVICIDEKPVQLLGEKSDPLPSAPGAIAKRDYEYVRQGTANVFCCVEPLTGKHINKVTEARNGFEFGSFLSDVYREYEKAEKIVLVMDNLSTHTQKSLVEFLGESDGASLWGKFEVHYTPKHASWLNQAEIAIGMLSKQCLGKQRIATIKHLERATNAWNTRVNKKARPFQWRFTREKAQLSLGYDI